MTADAERVASLLAKAERDLAFAEQALEFPRNRLRGWFI
jgi:hypothetical protein